MPLVQEQLISRPTCSPWVSEQCWVSHREEINGLCHRASSGLNRSSACAWDFKIFSCTLFFLSAFAFNPSLKPYHPPLFSQGLSEPYFSQKLLSSLPFQNKFPVNINGANRHSGSRWMTQSIEVAFSLTALGPSTATQQPCYKFIHNVYGFGQHLDEKIYLKNMLLMFLDIKHTVHVTRYEI